MNVYQAFFGLKDGVKDTDFVTSLEAYMEYLQNERGELKKWRLMRRKLGLGPKDLGEWHLQMEFEDLAALDSAFGHVAARSGEVETKHHAVNRMIDKITFMLYRDFPDKEREFGGELF